VNPPAGEKNQLYEEIGNIQKRTAKKKRAKKIVRKKAREVRPA